jgi:hypothetical protein
MHYHEYFYQCSPHYLHTIDEGLRSEILGAVSRLPERRKQLELNQDLMWLLGDEGWYFSSFPRHVPDLPPEDLGLGRLTRSKLEASRRRSECLASAILGHEWVFDFAKTFGYHRVCLEVQFGKKAALFMDFCKLRIAYYERRLSLGVVLVMCEPSHYFRHRRAAVSGMAEFSVAKEALPIIGLECPLWVIGLAGTR